MLDPDPANTSPEKRWDKHFGTIVLSTNGYDVLDCTQCGFRHIIPIPTNDETEKIYREAYYSEDKPLYIERCKEDMDWWNLVYDERYEMLEQRLPATRRGILDIGSGPGFFLLQGTKRGWQTVGMEPSLQSAQYSKGLGLEIVNAFLTKETAAQLGTFDVVHLCNVLEHLPDPAGTLAIARTLVHHDGFLMVIVPNDFNPFQELLRSNGYPPWWVAPPHHINFFNFNSLRTVLSKAGFEVVEHTTTFPMELFLLMGEAYVGNDEIGRRCHRKRMKLETMLANPSSRVIKQKLYRFMAELGLGRELVVIARPVH